MKTEWDYTALADAYLKRPDYAEAAIDAMLAVAGAAAGQPVCDVGAGVAHLTLMLAARGHPVAAVEPNDAMRRNGIARTAGLAQVTWTEGVGEATGQPAEHFALVTFGSSFNVCDRQAALAESCRILRPGGWFACMWNHRFLEDPIQARIEAIIRSAVPGYGYGVRREDQTAEIDRSGRFGPVIYLESRVRHRQAVADCIEAWRSHGTLARQAGEAFPAIIAEIARYLEGLGEPAIAVPYTTAIWMARRR
ncbi:MAG: class I SAM-dependent methyltransferase [Thalassobaculales bacterium]